MKKPITPQEWNILPQRERTDRALKLRDHLRNYRMLGICYGYCDIVRLSIEYQVPIPTNLENYIKKKDEELKYEGFI